MCFFFNERKRHEVFMESQKDFSHKKTLKRTGNSTRTWRSVEDALQVILTRFIELQNSLQIFAESNDVDCYISPRSSGTT